MEPERWQRIEQIYNSALEIEISQRAAFVAVACDADEALREEVESLLARAERGISFLETPAMALAAKAMVGAGGTRALPAAIGRYRVVRVLGEGGMGAVYEAEQDQPRRTVALKIIKPGYATDETLRRFQHESQALGRLQHPGIAQIYEASTADTGFGPQPYFAMEFIRGRPLLEYAEVQPLNARERLALMAKVCDAVEHAHQRAVIHRDLKPGNILVDETGQPKILDFGVARVTESDAQLTRQTDVGQLVGTLAYMSPEQVAGDPSALDTRSDVYALGVTLYELLAGRLPHDINHKPLHEAVRIIRDEEPANLSSIHRSYRGDIDTIAAKALEKDKARRYASAADLAGDIRRYLADEPITARPASAGYQLQKFARRHKALVAGTAAVFLVLAAGVMASTWEAVRARTAERAAVEQRDRTAAAERLVTAQRDRAVTAERLATAQRDRAVAADARAEQERNGALTEKRRADAEAATAQAVNDFLQNDLLAQASASTQARPSTKPDPELKVGTALDRAAARIAGKFDRQPEVEAAIHDTIGQSYIDLGLYPEARKQFEQALKLHRRIAGEENPKALKTMGRLGRTLFLQGKYAEARALLSHACEVSRLVLGPEDPETLYSMTNLATVYLSEGNCSSL
jgi:predicted Ser/Thr protein kinase/tetratricopeptide (TPR) repeat protein